LSYEISTDRSRLDLGLIHRYLSEESYWARGVDRATVERSIENSLPFGVYRGDDQVGFARAVTDKATFAWLADVFVVAEHRGQGLGKRLVERMLDHPDLKPMRRWMLGTADAHGLYSRFGFAEVDGQRRIMARESAEDARRCAGD
jgi:GNAT superfamily N-acetyltransferase